MLLAYYVSLSLQCSVIIVYLCIFHVGLPSERLDARQFSDLLEGQEGDAGVRTESEPVWEEALVETVHALGPKSLYQAVQRASVHHLILGHAFRRWKKKVLKWWIDF